MRNKYVFTVLLLFLLSMVSFGVVKMTEIQPSGEEEFLVVTSFYPVYIAAKNITVGAESVTVQNLTEPTTGCLHDYQLSTKDLKLLEHADLLIINGGGMESFLEDVTQQFPELKIVETTEGIELLTASDAEGHEELEEEHNHELEERHEEVPHQEESHEHTHEHMHGALNAHVWMDIECYDKQLENITQALVELNPQQSSCFGKNLQRYTAELDKIKEAAAEMRASQPKRVISFHDAFAYTAQMCGLEVAEAINMDEESTLSAAQIGQMIDKVKEEDINYLLVDEVYGKKAAEAVAKETGAKIIWLDTLVSGPYDEHAYLHGMEKNLESVKEGLR